jgi:hypothetical protein
MRRVGYVLESSLETTYSHDTTTTFVRLWANKKTPTLRWGKRKYSKEKYMEYRGSIYLNPPNAYTPDTFFDHNFG